MRTHALLLMLLATGGCTRWRVVNVSPEALNQAPAQARVTLPDGSRVIVQEPLILGDSLHGVRSPGGSDSIAVPLSRVERLAVPVPDHARASALGLFAGAAAATFAFWFALVLAQD